MSCNICYDRDIDCVFIPCGHATTCVQCASAFDISRYRTTSGKLGYAPCCAICREPGKIYKLYGGEHVKVDLMKDEIRRIEEQIRELTIVKADSSNKLDALEDENEILNSKIQIKLRENKELSQELTLTKRLCDIRNRIDILKSKEATELEKLENMTNKVTKITMEYSKKLSEYRDIRRNLCQIETEINRMVAKTGYLETNGDIVDVELVKDIFETSRQNYSKQTLKKAIDELCFDPQNKYTYLDTTEKISSLNIGDEIRYLAFNPNNVKHNLKISRLYRVVDKCGNYIKVDRKDEVKINLYDQFVFMRIKLDDE